MELKQIKSPERTGEVQIKLQDKVNLKQLNVVRNGPKKGQTISVNPTKKSEEAAKNEQVPKMQFKDINLTELAQLVQQGLTKSEDTDNDNVYMGEGSNKRFCGLVLHKVPKGNYIDMIKDKCTYHKSSLLNDRNRFEDASKKKLAITTGRDEDVLILQGENGCVIVSRGAFVVFELPIIMVKTSGDYYTISKPKKNILVLRGMHLIAHTIQNGKTLPVIFLRRGPKSPKAEIESKSEISSPKTFEMKIEQPKEQLSQSGKPEAPKVKEGALSPDAKTQETPLKLPPGVRIHKDDTKKFDDMGIRIVKYIGKGAYGHVFEAVYTSDKENLQQEEDSTAQQYGPKKRSNWTASDYQRKAGDRLALKLFLFDPYDKFDTKYLEQEESIAKVLQGNFPNLIKVRRFINTGTGRTYFFMDLAELGDLKNYIAKMKKEDQKFEYEVSKRLCKDIINGLTDLHELGYNHNDLRTDNIMLFKDGKGNLMARIGDFGMTAKEESAEKRNKEIQKLVSILKEINKMTKLTDDQNNSMQSAIKTIEETDASKPIDLDKLQKKSFFAN